MGRVATKPIERFLKYFVKSAGCWEWQGGLGHNGYGQFYDGKRTVRAHRYSHEYFKGLIPIGFQIDHLCRNKRCINPDHLEAVTQLVNIRRQKGHPTIPNACCNGHIYTPENTRITAKNHRRCRACNCIHQMNFKRRHNLLKKQYETKTITHHHT
jgi:HNH endonuclease